MFGRMGWALGAALLALTVGLGSAAAQEAAEGTNGDQAQQLRHRHRVRLRAANGDAAARQARVQERQRARFTDRDGDGVCDKFQTAQTERRRLRMAKAKGARNDAVAPVRGFGRGKGGAAGGAPRTGGN